MNRRRFLAHSTATVAMAMTSSRIASAQTGEPGHVITGDDPMAAAEYLSSLESSDHIPALYQLYDFIHPDAAEVVPRGTVIGWYQAEFLPRGPQTATAYDVTWLDNWTWDVTGSTYSDVAEVSFTQPFAEVGVIYDVVRLKFHDGAWRWWFGRDADFVKEQIHRFSLIENTPQEGNAPFGLQFITTVDDSLLERLPETLKDPETGTEYEISQSAGSFNPDGVQEPKQLLIYKPVDGSEFQLASIYYGSVVDSTSNEEDLLRFADIAQNAPPVEFRGWNAVPEAGPSWLQTEIAGVDVMGASYTMTLVMDGNYLQLRVFSAEAFATLCESLATD